MLDRLSVATLLKSVIAVMAICVVFVLGMSSWQSWKGLQATSGIATVAEASLKTFTAMHNLRTDRASTLRSLNAEQPIDSEMTAYVRKVRNALNPALASSQQLVAQIDFPEKDSLLSDLARVTQTVAQMEPSYWAEVAKPKSQRTQGLVTRYSDAAGELLAVLEKISNRLSAKISHADPQIDQLLLVKQLAWLLRNTAGDTSQLIANALSSGSPPPDAARTYYKLLGGMDAAWSALELAAAGNQFPSDVTSALAEAKVAYFDAQYVSLRDRLFEAIISGQPAEMTMIQWTPYSVARMGSAVTVAERALGAAKDRGVVLYDTAQHALIVQLILQLGSILLAVAAMVAVNRRAIVPLQKIRNAMIEVADGHIDADVPYLHRHDEIGALAGALGTFKQNAQEKARIESEQAERSKAATNRQRAIESFIASFESQIGSSLEALARASGEMNQTSVKMSDISDRTNNQVHMAAKASDSASANVQSVAAASEELSMSITDISRQVSHAAGITTRAVEQISKTDTTVRGLAETASRIGDVIELINAIAGQTNLLALNATIEAARAGEAGRGFAVVASEVKSLASQTAKATEEISLQISAVQKVAQEAVSAIKGIGGTISEVNEVATAIAAAVEEQGAATQEITRNTQQAAQGTEQVSVNIAGVTEGADATGQSAQNVRTAAELLSIQAESLRKQVNDFLGNIRAA